MSRSGPGGGSASQRLDVSPAKVEMSIPAKLQLATLTLDGDLALGLRVTPSRWPAVESIPS